MERIEKPLTLNPIKLSQPMGAMLAFLGVKNCMPLMHGAQGCASFSKVFFTRHFCDPIAVQTTAVNDITAVIDGGERSISEAIENITKKVTPDLVGLFTTGMTETKGDDIKGATYLLRDKQKIAYVHTPDFEGSFESGWAAVQQALIKQLVHQSKYSDKSKVALLPNVSMTPYEVECVKNALAQLGLECFALPDLSTSLDGHLGLKQGALSSDGISTQEIEKLGECGLVLTVGASVKSGGELLRKKCTKMQHLHFDSLSGLEASDLFYKQLLDYTGHKKPPRSVIHWRKRLQDAMLDTHFVLGSTKLALSLEPDQSYALAGALQEAGGNIETIVLGQKGEYDFDALSKNVRIGDFEDIEALLPKADAFIGNYHGHRLCKNAGKVHILRGFPNYEEVGNQLKSDILYEGSARLLFEVANSVKLAAH